jgi:hypothetical protein
MKFESKANRFPWLCQWQRDIGQMGELRKIGSRFQTLSQGEYEKAALKRSKDQRRKEGEQ